MNLNRQKRAALRKIELPSEALGEELQGLLEEKKVKGLTYDKAHRTIQFPDNMNSYEWSSLRGTVEKWAKGRNLQVVESLRLQYLRTEASQSQPRVDTKALQVEVKKKVDGLNLQSAEERYKYLASKPISELTDAEIQERLALAQRPLGKTKDSKK